MTSQALWRRILLVAITALVAALAVSFSKPADAHAFVDPSIVRVNYVGWGEVRSDSTPARACPAIYPAPSYCYNRISFKTAYRWTGRSWVPQSIAGGTQVYIYPYTGSWAWIWTQRTGWLAIQRGELSTGQRCPTYAFC
jgi:hypothetical protein